jgi:hypothetical protein
MITLVISSCENKNSKEKISKDAEEAILVKKCLAHMYKKGSELTYLVSPKFANFEFDAFFKENKILEKVHKESDYNQKKSQVFKLLKWTDKDFKQIQQKINNKYFNKINPTLLKLSNSKISQSVVYFSGIHENLVFATVVDYCKSIKISDLTSSYNKKQPFMSAGSVIFILTDGEVQEVILENGVSMEGQCPN